MQFEEMIGKEVALIMPLIHATHFQQVIIHGVEHGGLWIESQAINEIAMRAVKIQAAPRTLLFFVPYHQITLGMSSTEKVSLSEKSFGV